ncbi:glycosyltransferase family 4 protein [Flavobacteriaceae bacterium F89]|uniref:Glycosyltransferase family 4 protein n=1 Tax=Cerina litoralis TaxID=2874477 RepID=A0AAE3JR00_9FLAO|nr:glycosyltransferase family 4 protein [Cerina litoralis]MCG2459122.1 glycosyltransferase family 4 protein [Cerina litoralis]
MGKIKGKKICHLTSAHTRNDIRIFQKECVSLAKGGYDISLVVADGLPDEVDKGVKIYGVAKETSRVKRFVKASKNVFLKALEINADIYHFHDPELLPFGNKLKKRGYKVIFDSHEDLPRQIMGKEYLPKFSRRIVASLLERYEDYCCKKYDSIITATPFINERFLKINKRSVNINNYPLLNEFKGGKSTGDKLRSKISYVGGITEIRGLTYLIRSLENCEVVLQLAGSITPNSYQKELMEEEGWKKVEYLGNVSRTEVKEILNTSIAGIVTFLPYPNHINAQPNKLFEYMSAGIPVIASNYPLWKGIVEKYNAGICVNPENIDEIATAITYLVQNPSIAQQMGANGRKAVEEVFNWEQEEKKLIDVYNSMSV